MAIGNLIEAIDRVLVVEPSLGPAGLDRVREDGSYTAPEAMYIRFGQAIDVLCEHCPREHEKHDVVSAAWFNEEGNK